MEQLYITTIPGISEISKEEVAKKIPSASVAAIEKLENNDLVIINDSTLNDLIGLRTAEDFYYLLGSLPLTGTKHDLSKIVDFLKNCSNLELGLRAHRQLQGGRKKAKRTKFRVVAQAKDSFWRQYRRVDMQRAAEKGISLRYKPWRLVADDAHIEFWLQQAEKKLYISIRLSDKTTRHREYKGFNIKASLRPTIAAAMVFLSEPKSDDVFLDPMCGAGTILIERALWGDFKRIFGGDIDTAAVSSAKSNSSLAHKNIEVNKWDARKLPVGDSSVDKIVSNLPWGRKVGTPEQNEALYTNFFKEVERVLVSKGIGVFLTSEWNLMKKILGQSKGLKLKRQIKSIKILGYHADIYLLERV